MGDPDMLFKEKKKETKKGTEIAGILKLFILKTIHGSREIKHSILE